LVLPDGREFLVDRRLTIGSHHDNDIVIRDSEVSRHHCAVEVDEDGKAVIKDRGSMNGTRIFAARVSVGELLPGMTITLGTKATLRVLAAIPDEPIVGSSPEIERVRHQVQQLGLVNGLVVIVGETGTGKELVARALHSASRRHGEFAHITCGSINQAGGLIESFLFGHEAGSFTGATARRSGIFEHAHQGTLLLDDITELPLDVQPALLRVVEHGTFTPVGGTRPIEVDVRIIASSKIPLDEAVRKGQLRTDLFYRLSTYQIELPPLRVRKTDIPELARHFLHQNGSRARISEEGIDFLLGHDWPGNAWELRACMERAAVLGKSPLEPRDLRLGTSELPKDHLVVELEGRTLGTTLDEVKRAILERALRLHGGKSLRQAARSVGVPANTFLRWAREYKLIA
jgi:DNA-binding NtrC family response regulator